MDPLARRSMWAVVAGLKARSTVILTTHSMDECEALCERLGIMVGGRLRCLGSAQHLKRRFGRGHTLELKLAAAAAVTEVKAQAEAAAAWVAARLPGTTVIEQHGRLLRFQLPRGEGEGEGEGGAGVSLAEVFRVAEEAKRRLGAGRQERALSLSDYASLLLFIRRSVWEVV
jgi:ABC-type multidrug transport system ATPase subunit